MATVELPAAGMAGMLPPRNATAQVAPGNNFSNPASVVCYSPMMVTAYGIWQGVNPLEFSLPLFILQTAIIVATTRLLVLLLKPIRQPRVIAEILAGVILGPSVMGQVEVWGTTVFPVRSLLTLETVAHLGLLYFLFLVGLEMDVNVIRRSGKKALIIAVAGMALPFCIGTATSFVFRHQVSKNVHQASFLLFLGVALSVTAFPVLARILAEIKLLNSDLGRIAMSAAIVNDMCAWILLALAIAISEVNSSAFSSLWVLLSGVFFVLACFYGVRPLMWWIARRVPEGEAISDVHVTLVLTGVMVAGVCTDAIGIHSVFGAFVYGLVIPSGQLGVVLIEKLEDFVTGLLLPLFFAISGLRSPHQHFPGARSRHRGAPRPRVHHGQLRQGHGHHPHRCLLHHDLPRRRRPRLSHEHQRTRGDDRPQHRKGQGGARRRVVCGDGAGVCGDDGARDARGDVGVPAGAAAGRLQAAQPAAVQARRRAAHAGVRAHHPQRAVHHLAAGAVKPDQAVPHLHLRAAPGGAHRARVQHARRPPLRRQPEPRLQLGPHLQRLREVRGERGRRVHPGADGGVAVPDDARGRVRPGGGQARVHHRAPVPQAADGGRRDGAHQRVPPGLQREHPLGGAVLGGHPRGPRPQRRGGAHGERAPRGAALLRRARRPGGARVRVAHGGAPGRLPHRRPVHPAGLQGPRAGAAAAHARVQRPRARHHHRPQERAADGRGVPERVPDAQRRQQRDPVHGAGGGQQRGHAGGHPGPGQRARAVHRGQAPRRGRVGADVGPGGVDGVAGAGAHRRPAGVVRVLQDGVRAGDAAVRDHDAAAGGRGTSSGSARDGRPRPAVRDQRQPADVGGRWAAAGGAAVPEGSDDLWRQLHCTRTHTHVGRFIDRGLYVYRDLNV
ncbi:Cation/H(+) antiporter 15 [Zea mays]|uniref:Cation/H(+) antiporter 15 n=1 Tax=Zea mays TaxID=4577 RepID=A0A1D6FSG5_MAIZE|nr:Cation/H(+) antiporter 15 [Zea mays]